MSPQNILITGGCGFIGTNLIKKLIEKNSYSIRVLDNLSVGTENDLGRIGEYRKINPQDDPAFSPNKIELVKGDIRDYKTCLKSSKGCTVIIHLAASTGVDTSIKNPQKDMSINVAGTLNMLEAARVNNVEKFIFASSGATIGETEPPIHENLLPHPISPYGASKLAGEAYCSVYYQSFGLKTVSLRFGNVYGPGSLRKKSVVAKFITQAINGETLEIYGDGNQTRDFIYVEDLNNAILEIISLKNALNFPWGEVFQIATGRETTVNELLNSILSLLADFGFNNIKVKNTSPRTGEIRRNYSDIKKAQKYLKWYPQFDLQYGLKETINWFVNNINLFHSD